MNIKSFFISIDSNLLNLKIFRSYFLRHYIEFKKLQKALPCITKTVTFLNFLKNFLIHVIKNVFSINVKI